MVFQERGILPQGFKPNIDCVQVLKDAWGPLYDFIADSADPVIYDRWRKFRLPGFADKKKPTPLRHYPTSAPASAFLVVPLRGTVLPWVYYPKEVIVCITILCSLKKKKRSVFEKR